MIVKLQIACQLHCAFDSEDPQLAQRALADPFIRHMDVEFSKLTRIIPLPKGFDSLENAAKPPKTNLESLNMDELRAIDDEVMFIYFIKHHFENETPVRGFYVTTR